jgi:hypothetical protein
MGRKIQAELSFQDSTVNVQSALIGLERSGSFDLHFGMPLPENSRKRTFRVACLDCEKRFSTNSFLPTCPRCGSSDIEPA